MAKSVTSAARVDADQDDGLQRRAAATGRRKSWLISEALRSYVASEQQFLVAVEEGKQTLRDGKSSQSLNGGPCLRADRRPASVTIRWTQQANDEFLGIITWIAASNPAAAALVIWRCGGSV